MKEIYHLSLTESQIMEKLWMQTEPIKQTALLAMFNEEGKEWGRQTLNTLLIRLENRGFVKREKRLVSVSFSKEIYAYYIMKSAIDEYLDGDYEKAKDFFQNRNNIPVLNELGKKVQNQNNIYKSVIFF